MFASRSSISHRVLSLTALNVFVLSPLLAYELRLGDGGPDRTFLFVFPLSLLSLAFLHTATSQLRVLHLLLLPFYLAVAVDDFVIWQYDTRLASSMLLVIVENIGDAGEYVGAHAPEVFGAPCIGKRLPRGARLRTSALARAVSMRQNSRRRAPAGARANEKRTCS